jgi:two-component system response regulator TctD
VRVLLRRSSKVADPRLRQGQLEFDSNTREFRLAGQPLSLTPRERAVLEVLMLKAGSTVAKSALAQSLTSFDQDVTPDAIEIYVHRLRKKLEGSGTAIVTLRGLGYLLRQVAHDG